MKQTFLRVGYTPVHAQIVPVSGINLMKLNAVSCIGVVRYLPEIQNYDLLDIQTTFCKLKSHINLGTRDFFDCLREKCWYACIQAVQNHA